MNRMQLFVLELFVAGSALLPSQGHAQPATASPKNLTKDVPVPLRDGVILRADLLLPSPTGRFPVLVYRTPYGKEHDRRRNDKRDNLFEKAVARGYAVVIQDVRGRYASGGKFKPHQNEGEDGYDTIEWAARQPWSDGNVGTFGLSYPGGVQWSAAFESPPHLKAMVVAFAGGGPSYYLGGVFNNGWLDWTSLLMAPDLRRRKHLAGPKTLEEAASAWETEQAHLHSFLPLRDLPDLKVVAPFYYEWLAHPPADSWWDWAERANKYDRVQPPVLMIAGWYDFDTGGGGSATDYAGLLAARKGEKDPRAHLVIGPWTHGNQNQSRAGEREFGPAAAVDYPELILRWMDHYIRGIGNGVDHEKPVRLFVMGTNVWRSEDTWPLPQARPQTFYLSSKAESDRSGKLQNSMPQGNYPHSTFVSDPAKPLTDPYEADGAHDYRALSGRKDVLVFDSDPLPADTEVTGPIRAEIYLSANCRDVDLWVRLLDVAPDGTAFNLVTPGPDVLRASYRRGSSKAELLEPNHVTKLILDRMVTSNSFLAGHRIRMQISGAFFPHLSRNLQTGESEITSSRTQAARIRIYHDAAHPSRLVLPVIPH